MKGKYTSIRMSGVEYRSPVGKRITFVDGKIEKTPMLGPRAGVGKTINRTFATVGEAFDFRAGSDAKTMFFVGTWTDKIRDGEAVLMPDKAVDGYRSHFEPGDAPVVVSATKEHLAFRSEPGFLPVDIDFKSADEVGALWPETPRRFEAPEEVRKALLDILPEAADAPLMVTASSSSMIVDSKTGKLVRGAGGWRALIAIDDASAIPRILETMHQRCWARGIHRYAFISKGGHFLHRSIADQALARPTQPDYPCADLGEGLAKAEGATVRWNVNGPFLVASSVQIDKATEPIANGKIEAARQELKPATEKLVTERKREHAAQLVKKGVPKRVAEKAASQRFDAGVLSGSDVIVFTDGKEVGVAELLREGELFNGRICFDPVEPGYDGGRPVGKFFWNAGLRPLVHSFAHGSKAYLLRYDDQTATAALQAVGADADRLAVILALSELSAIEHSQRERQVAQVLGLGNERRSIRVAVETIRRQAIHHAQEHDSRQHKEIDEGPTPLDKPLKLASFPHVVMTDKGPRILDHIDNVRRLLDGYGISYRYNLITKSTEWQHPGIVQEGDNADVELLAQVHSLAVLNFMTTASLNLHLPAITSSNAYNPVTDHLRSLTWDGKPRFTKLVGAMQPADWAIARIVIRLFFLQAVAAADHAVEAQKKHHNYRAHFEFVMVFVGMQGIGKTKGLRKLLPPKLRCFFKEGLTLATRDKDSVKAAVSCWIGELGELDATFRKSDVAELKAFLSKEVDEMRMPYARVASKFERRASFAGSVNDEDFLADETGNRRFGPLTVGRIDVEWPDDEIEQLWAEAWHRYSEKGEKWWPDEAEAKLLEVNAESFLAKSPLEELIERRYEWGKPPEGKRLQASQICDAIGLASHHAPIGALDKRALKTVGNAVARLWRRSGLTEKQGGVDMVLSKEGWVKVNAKGGKNLGWLMPPARRGGPLFDSETLEGLKRELGVEARKDD